MTPTDSLGLQTKTSIFRFEEDATVLLINTMKSPLKDRNWPTAPLYHSPENKHNASSFHADDMGQPKDRLVGGALVNGDEDTVDRKDGPPCIDGNTAADMKEVPIGSPKKDDHNSESTQIPTSINADEAVEKSNQGGEIQVHGGNRMHPKMRMKAAYKSKPRQASHSSPRQISPPQPDAISTAQGIELGMTDILLERGKLSKGTKRLSKLVKKILPGFLLVASESFKPQYVINSLATTNRRFVEYQQDSRVLQLVPQEIVVSFLLEHLELAKKMKYAKKQQQSTAGSYANANPAQKELTRNTAPSHVVHAEDDPATLEEAAGLKSKKRSSEELLLASPAVNTGRPTVQEADDKQQSIHGKEGGDQSSKRQKIDNKSRADSPKSVLRTGVGIPSDPCRAQITLPPKNSSATAPNPPSSTNSPLPKPRQASPRPAEPTGNTTDKKDSTQPPALRIDSKKHPTAKGKLVSSGGASDLKQAQPKTSHQAPVVDKIPKKARNDSSVPKKGSTPATKSKDSKKSNSTAPLGSKKQEVNATSGRDGRTKQSTTTKPKGAPKMAHLPKKPAPRSTAISTNKNAAGNAEATSHDKKSHPSTGKKSAPRKKVAKTQPTSLHGSNGRQDSTTTKSRTLKSRGRSRTPDSADVVVEKGTFLGIYWPEDRKFYTAIVEEAPTNPTGASDVLYVIRYLLDGFQEKIRLCDFCYMILLKEDAMDGKMDLPTAKRCHQLLGMSLAEAEEKAFAEMEAGEAKKAQEVVVLNENSSTESTNPTPKTMDTVDLPSMETDRELIDGMANLSLAPCTVESILEEMQGKPNDQKVFQRCLSKLLELCTSSQDVASEVVRRGGIALVVSAIHSFPEEKEILKLADKVLLTLYKESKEFAKQVMSENFVHSLTLIPGIAWANDPVQEESGGCEHGGVAIDIVSQGDNAQQRTSKILYPVLLH